MVACGMPQLRKDGWYQPGSLIGLTDLVAIRAPFADLSSIASDF